MLNIFPDHTYAIPWDVWQFLFNEVMQDFQYGLLSLLELGVAVAATQPCTN